MPRALSFLALFVAGSVGSTWACGPAAHTAPEEAAPGAAAPADAAGEGARLVAEAAAAAGVDAHVSAEEHAVLSAVIEHLTGQARVAALIEGFHNTEVRPWVIREQPLSLERLERRAGEDRADAQLDALLVGVAARDPSRFVHPMAHGATPPPPPARFDVTRLVTRRPLHGVSDALLAALQAEGGRERLFAHFDGAADLYGFSPVVFDDDHRAALVYAERQGGGCLSGTLFVLTRDGHAWKVTRKRLLWIT